MIKAIQLKYTFLYLGLYFPFDVNYMKLGNNRKVNLNLNLIS